MKPLVSVIIPAFNEEAFIDASLDALARQDYPNFEVIVADNASKDRTSERASAHAGVKVVHEPNKGTMWACARARKEARGEIIVRMDADCRPDPTWLSRGAAYFDDDRITIVSGPYSFYDSGAIFSFLARWTFRSFLLTNAFLRWSKLGGLSIGGNTFMRASALEKIGGFDTSFTFYGDDTDIAKRLSRIGLCVFDIWLVLPSSARRYQKHGVIKLTFTYWSHFLREVFRGTKKAARA